MLLTTLEDDAPVLQLCDLCVLLQLDALCLCAAKLINSN